MARLTLQKPGLLLGEGKDEVEFFGAMLTEMGLIDQVQVLDYGGAAKLKTFLADLVQLPGFEKLNGIAVTRDADEDAASARTSLESILEASPVSDLVSLCAADSTTQTAFEFRKAVQVGRCLHSSPGDGIWAASFKPGDGTSISDFGGRSGD